MKKIIFYITTICFMTYSHTQKNIIDHSTVSSISEKRKSFSVQDLLDHADKNITVDQNGVFDLSHQQLSSLDGLQNISDPFKVKHLILSHNNLTKLEETFFYPFKNLTRIDLHHNKIKNIMYNCFYYNAKIKRINLDNNRLNYLSSKSFASLPNLQRLSLRNNRLSALPIHIFNNNNSSELKVLTSGNTISKTNLFRIEKRKKKIELIH